jgi:hypothetical protein
MLSCHELTCDLLAVCGLERREQSNLLVRRGHVVVIAEEGLNVTVLDEGMTPRSSIFAYPVPAKEEARSKDTQSPQGPTLRLGVEGKNYL